MKDFKERELTKEFIGSIFKNIMKKFHETKYYELCDKDGDFIYSYEISCKDDFIKYIYSLISINKNNANFDNFNIEFIRNYNCIYSPKEEEFLVIIEYKKIKTGKIYTGIKIKKTLEKIDLNSIFHRDEENKNKKEND